jgi:hypothetical protein
MDLRCAYHGDVCPELGLQEHTGSLACHHEVHLHAKQVMTQPLGCRAENAGQAASQEALRLELSDSR